MMRVGRATLALAVALAAFVTVSGGCQAVAGIEDTTVGDGGTGEPGFTFAVLTPAVALPLGGLAPIDIEIQRTGGFDGAVTIAPRSAPSGLIAEPLTVPAGETTAELAELIVGAQAPLNLGDTLDFELEATADGLDARTVAITAAEITGRPGLIDVTFGPDATGYVGIGFGSDDGGAFTAIEVTPDDKLLVVGFGLGGLGGRHFHIARLTGEGERDTTFNSGNVVNTSFAGSTADEATAIAVGRQVDGNIVAIGSRQRLPDEPFDVGLVQYRPDGTLGSQLFGNHAPAQGLLDGGGLENANDGAVLPDNKIVAVGGRDGRMFVARATSLGDEDDEFGVGGFVAPLGTQASAGHALAIDGQGRFVVAGFAIVGGQSDVALVRLLPSGELDASFGDGGVVIAGNGLTNESASAVAILPDGRIVTAGTTDSRGNRDFELRRFLATGEPDDTFGMNGVTRPAITAGNDDVVDMAALPDGRVVVVGNAAGAGPIVARYTRDGALDPLFDDDGVLSLFVGDNGEVHAVSVQSNHKIVITGGNEGGVPGPGTFGITVRMWM